MEVSINNTISQILRQVVNKKVLLTSTDLFFRLIFIAVIVQPLMVKYDDGIITFILVLMSIIWCLNDILEDD